MSDSHPNRAHVVDEKKLFKQFDEIEREAYERGKRDGKIEAYENALKIGLEAHRAHQNNCGAWYGDEFNEGKSTARSRLEAELEKLKGENEKTSAKKEL